MKKYNIITHLTTSCNYNCSYCDVVKDNKYLNISEVNEIIKFIKNNYKSINRFKFFGGEPLLAFKNIKYIIDNTKNELNKFEIVTNTTLLNDEIGTYFQKYFYIIFFSIDSENPFDFQKVSEFIKKYSLEKKVYFNLIISPGKHDFAFEQFEKLINLGLKNFNILPVYYTKIWSREDLLGFSKIMKKILDKSLTDKEINLYGFQQNSGYNNSLINESLFIDTDLNIYYSDFVSTFLGKKIQKELLISVLKSLDLSKDLILENKKNLLLNYEKEITSKVLGQQKLHEIMDYFSKYLNKKNGI